MNNKKYSVLIASSDERVRHMSGYAPLFPEIDIYTTGTARDTYLSMRGRRPDMVLFDQELEGNPIRRRLLSEASQSTPNKPFVRLTRVPGELPLDYQDEISLDEIARSTPSWMERIFTRYGLHTPKEEEPSDTSPRVIIFPSISLDRIREEA